MKNFGEKFVHDSLSQDFYDSFNNFIMSKDQKVFNKLMSKCFFLELTKDIPGDVVELGVFRGSGVYSWIKMLNYLRLSRKVYGFDYFNADELIKGIDTKDVGLMASLFNDRGFDILGYENTLNKKLHGDGFANFELIAGDVFLTIPVFLEKHPGFRASVINFDLDTEKPTYFALDHLWDRLVTGGVLIFDEYAINEWTESDAVDRFVIEKNLILKSTNLDAPSAYIVK
jgi:hypothetical protein